MCSLCLCHNKDLTKIDKVQEKYINFLKKVLLQPHDVSIIFWGQGLATLISPRLKTFTTILF